MLFHKQEMEIEMLRHCWNKEQLEKESEPCESVESDTPSELRCEVLQQHFPNGREGQEPASKGSQNQL